MYICTETGNKVKISPEHKYSDDFEPYESVDMEVSTCVTPDVLQMFSDNPAVFLCASLLMKDARWV